jgi:hypothetical protein
MLAAARASACAGCRRQRLAGLTLSPVQFANHRGIRAGAAARQDLSCRAGAKYQVYRPFSGSRRGGQVETLPITGWPCRRLPDFRRNIILRGRLGGH